MVGMLLAKNRKALFDHQLINKYVAGVVLKGYEVKAIKEKKVNFEGSYIIVQKNEAFIINLHIGEYSKQSQEVTAFESKRTRKLLLNKKEIQDIAVELDQKGRTAVPLALVLLGPHVKLELGVVKGKKEFEKKQTAKEKQIRKDLEKEAKNLHSWR